MMPFLQPNLLPQQATKGSYDASTSKETALRKSEPEKPFPSALFHDGDNVPIHLAELGMRSLSYALRCVLMFLLARRAGLIRQM